MTFARPSRRRKDRLASAPTLDSEKSALETAGEPESLDASPGEKTAGPSAPSCGTALGKQRLCMGEMREMYPFVGGLQVSRVNNCARLNLGFNLV